jgi:serine/threonine protein kinase
LIKNRHVFEKIIFTKIMTADNLFYFSVEYMAPEVVTKGSGYSKPSDWWSFGVFAFDLLTGRSPFYSNRGKAETKQRILHGKLVLPAYVTQDAQVSILRNSIRATTFRINFRH